MGNELQLTYKDLELEIQRLEIIIRKKNERIRQAYDYTFGNPLINVKAREHLQKILG